MITCNKIIEKIISDKTNIDNDTSFVRITKNGKKYFIKVLWGELMISEVLSKEARHVRSTPPHRTEGLILRLFNETILKTGLSPHIVQSYENHICDLPKGKIKGSLKYKMNERTMIPEFGAIVMEDLQFSLGDILDADGPLLNSDFGRVFIDATLFQVTWTLHIIQQLFPGFSHNDFHIYNIMFKSAPGYSPANQQFIEYVLDGESYYIPFFGFMPKIIDFAFSMVPERNILSSIILSVYKKVPYMRDDLSYLLFHMATKSPELLPILQKYNKEIDDSGVMYTEMLERVPNYKHILKRQSIWKKYEPAEKFIIARHGDKLESIGKKIRAQNLDPKPRIKKLSQYFKHFNMQKNDYIHEGK